MHQTITTGLFGIRLWLVLALASAGLAADNGWQWPIDTRYGLTASFGEYRGDRFHMGIDFSTNGREGMRVFPAKGGRIQKIRAQAHGYGRVVYLSHEDGYISVYGHLAGFGEKINEVLVARGVDPFDDFGTMRLPVQLTPQDVLGYSGESGGGLPHLHFEIRSAKNVPIDPLLLDFPPIQRGFPLRLAGIRLLPLSAGARVDGGHLPVFVPATNTTCQARGEIGIQVIAHLETSRGNRLGVSGVRINAGGAEIGAWEPRRIPYDHYRRAGAVFDQARSGFSPTRYVYAMDGRRDMVGAVSGLKVTGNLHIDGATKVEIRVRDLAGKWHAFVFELDPNTAAQYLGDLEACTAVQPTTLELTPWRSGIQVRGTVPGTLVLPDEMIGLASDETRFLPLAFTDTPQTWIWRTDHGSVRRTIGWLPAHKAGRVSIGDFVLNLGADTLHQPQVAVLLPPNVRIMEGTLDYISPIIHFGRNGIPVPDLQLRFPVSTPHAGVFAWSYHKKRWMYWGEATAADSPWVTAKLDYLTPVVVARDLSAPVIGSRATHIFFEGKREIIPLRDRGSGIDPASISVTSNGRNVAFFYDRDRGWVVLSEQVAGSVEIQVADRTGVQASRRR